MRLFTYILTILVISIQLNRGIAQTNQVYELFGKYEKFYREGDVTNARKTIETIISFKDTLNSKYLFYAYNNIGVISTMAGRFNEAIHYLNKAEGLLAEDESLYAIELSGTYINKARIFNIQKNYSQSIEYLEKAIRNCRMQGAGEKQTHINLSAATQNLGISFYGRKEYDKALHSFKESLKIKSNFNLDNIALSLLNIGKTYAKLGSNNLAEEYFQKSIEKFKNESGDYFYRLADVYAEYGDFLMEVGRTGESLNFYEKALEICYKNYESKHPALSHAYKKIGEYYTHLSEYHLALTYYQKAVVAIVNGYNDHDIFSTPPLVSAILDVELLSILQHKSDAFELWALQHENVQEREAMMMHGLTCSELVLQLVNKLRVEYYAGEERFKLMENEKESYFRACRIARKLYEMTGEKFHINKMYDYARQSKAGILRSSILESEVFKILDIPVSLKNSYQEHMSDIAVYTHLIHEETKSVQPDRAKIEFWKDAIFKLNRGRESLKKEIHELFPEYQELLRKTEPISLSEMQIRLRKDETLVEYFISSNKDNTGREIYIFVTNQKRLDYHYTITDHAFEENLRIINNNTRPAMGFENEGQIMSDYLNALHTKYVDLIKPVEHLLHSQKIIVIPDEEIAYLPFDAFIRTKPARDHFHFESPDYLIKHMAISYGYSSSLIFNSAGKSKRIPEVFAFAPTYTGCVAEYDVLHGASREIKSILNWFRGNTFTGEFATERNFKMKSQNEGIFHLAMHSHIDTLDSRYSYLMFNTENDSLEDGKLNHYEISLLRMQSPMVVLSACNTGSGNLFYGEGIINLARAFILAGASSVVKTFWEINDEISSEIIISFYDYLARGKEKDEALRHAKLDYLKISRPAFAAPYFWAGYQIIGNKESLKKKTKYSYLIFSAMVFAIAVVWFYCKRRRILLAPS